MQWLAWCLLALGVLLGLPAWAQTQRPTSAQAAQAYFDTFASQGMAAVVVVAGVAIGIAMVTAGGFVAVRAVYLTLRGL